MSSRFKSRLNTALERHLPEQRLFLKSEEGTRFIRLRPITQASLVLGSAIFVGWTLFVTSIFLIETISSGNARELAAREQQLFHERLNQLASQRDAHVVAVAAAHDRFEQAMDQVAEMQTLLLDSEERRRELETAVDVIQATLRRTLDERDEARSEVAAYQTELEAETGTALTAADRQRDLEHSLALVSEALETTSQARDNGQVLVARAEEEINRLNFEAALTNERQDRVFRQLEEAVAVSMEPLDEMFSAVGLRTEDLIESVRRGYSGQGGPLTPIISSSGGQPDPMSDRANALLRSLDEINLHRLAAESLPFGIPVRGNFRNTSGFGPRRDPINGGTRMHNGTDFAAARGTPIVAGGNGTVVFAGRQSGYGLMVEVQHANGYRTRYAHLTRIRVNLGQRVSRGDRIGDMGCTGRCTGVHLHYEVRRNGTPVNPMTFIRAGRDVF